MLEKLDSDYPDLAEKAQNEYSSETMSQRYLEEYDNAGNHNRKLLVGMNFSIVTPSEWLARRVRLSFLHEKKLRVVHNGISTSIFDHVESKMLREELNIPITNKVVLAVAPDIMSERKGGEWVLKLAKSISNKNISYVIVGI